MPSFRSRSTDPGDLDGIDFKPFFDMVVGVLFVLLILISAQMFFTQWGSARDPAKVDADEIALAWDEEQRRFILDVADRLRIAGFSVTPDEIARTVAIPLSSVVTIGPDAQPGVDPKLATAGAVLSERLACLRRDAAGSDCLTFNYLALGDLASATRLRGAATPGGIAPDRYSYLLSTVLLGAMLQAAPGLLADSGRPDGATVRAESSVATDGHGSGLGDLAFRFTFRPPPELAASRAPATARQRP